MAPQKRTCHLFGVVAVALALARVPAALARVSCIQTTKAVFSPACPCGDNFGSFTFSMKGITSVDVNTINLAVVDTSSSSFGDSDPLLKKEFAKDIAAAFAERNLFRNSGAASYVQFDGTGYTSGTFNSMTRYDAFVDSTPTATTSKASVAAGIAKGRQLLNAIPSSMVVMVVVTDGTMSEEGGHLKAQANAARVEGTTIFAVGVGDLISQETLLAAAGRDSNVFNINSFGNLKRIVRYIVSASEHSTVQCPATGIAITVEFGAPVTSVVYPGAIVLGSHKVAFTAVTLEFNPTTFAVELDTCDIVKATSVVTSVHYVDDQGNSPDVSGLLSSASVLECDGGARPGAQRASSRKLQSDYDCSDCLNLTSAQIEALASYDNGGKRIVCDPTCLDGISDPTHCNYFGLGQICRSCGDCTTCIPCPEDPADTPSPTPDIVEVPSPTPESTEAPVGVPEHAPASTPSTAPVVSTTDDDEGNDNVSTTDDEDGNKDDDDERTTQDEDDDDDDEEEEEDDDDEEEEEEEDDDDDDDDKNDDDDDDDDEDDDEDDDKDDDEYDCPNCSNLTSAQIEALASFDNGGKKIVCDPTCLDRVSDPTHCNYFGLGQICRGCGDCTTCTPCP